MLKILAKIRLLKQRSSQKQKTPNKRSFYKAIKTKLRRNKRVTLKDSNEVRPGADAIFDTSMNASEDMVEIELDQTDESPLEQTLKNSSDPSTSVRGSSSQDLVDEPNMACLLNAPSGEQQKILAQVEILTPLELTSDDDSSSESFSLSYKPMNVSQNVELNYVKQIDETPENVSSSDPLTSVRRSCWQDFISEPNRNCSSNGQLGEPDKILVKMELHTPTESISHDNSSSESFVDPHFFEISYGVFSTELEYIHSQNALWHEIKSIFEANQLEVFKPRAFIPSVRRDQLIISKQSTLTPLFLESLLNEIIERGAQEKGVLRAAGDEDKVNYLWDGLKLSSDPYPQLLRTADIHDLTGVLKNWIKQLPKPLLTNELLPLFYKSHKLPVKDQAKVLLTLCKMLPQDNRKALQAVLIFCNKIIKFEKVNRMNIHNVAKTMAQVIIPLNEILSIDLESLDEIYKFTHNCRQIMNGLIRLFQTPIDPILVAETD